MKRYALWLLLAAIFFLVVGGFLAVPAKTSIAQQLGNKVRVHFATLYDLQIHGDAFSNQETTGQAIWRIPNIVNTTDETGEPVRELRVTLQSDLAFEWVDKESLVQMGPPVYEWYFGDLVEEHLHTGWATDVLVGFINQSPVRFTPGFDVSRTFDETVFSEPGTQTVTVTVTPREEWLESVEIFVHAQSNESVDSFIIAHSAGEQAHVTPDGQYSEVGITGNGIPTELDKPVSIAVTFQVTPKVAEIEHKPHVGIKPNWRHEGYGGSTAGSSVSYTNGAGTWTVSALGDYIWEWGAGKVPGYGVGFHPVANSRPALTSGSVTPLSGGADTPFAFKVTYADIDGNPPSQVNIYIDGSARSMDYLRGAEQGYADGAVYGYTTLLSAGQHSYYFEASDGSLLVRFPESDADFLEVTSQEPGFLIWVIIPFGIIVAGLVAYLLIIRLKKRVSG